MPNTITYRWYFDIMYHQPYGTHKDLAVPREDLFSYGRNGYALLRSQTNFGNTEGHRAYLCSKFYALIDVSEYLTIEGGVEKMHVLGASSAFGSSLPVLLILD